MAEREILIRIAGQDDLDSISRLYSNYMFDSHLSKFGDSFVKKYLKVILKSKNCVTLVAVGDQAAGFIMAAFSCSKILCELFFNIEFLSSCVKQVLAHPRLAFKSLGLILYPFNSGIRGVNSELLFIAVEPGYRGRNLGASLIKKVLSLMKENEIKKVKVSTLAANEAVNALLKKLGFELKKTFKLFKNRAHLYVYEI